MVRSNNHEEKSPRDVTFAAFENILLDRLRGLRRASITLPKFDIGLSERKCYSITVKIACSRSWLEYSQFIWIMYCTEVFNEVVKKCMINMPQQVRSGIPPCLTTITGNICLHVHITKELSFWQLFKFLFSLSAVYYFVQEIKSVSDAFKWQYKMLQWLKQLCQLKF
jgi:hypothetical protein